AMRGPARVGLQVGHLEAVEQPDELAELRYSTGAHWDGVDEVEVNLAIVTALADRLRERGLVVDVLPATVPPRYRADLLLSAHAVPPRNPDEQLLKLHLDRAVLGGTGVADDDRNVTGDMMQYYGFNHGRYRHAAHPRTPAVLVELGYLSNARDRELLASPDA